MQAPHGEITPRGLRGAGGRRCAGSRAGAGTREKAPWGEGGDERSRLDCHRVGAEARVGACRHAPWGSVAGGPNGADLQPASRHYLPRRADKARLQRDTDRQTVSVQWLWF